MSGETKQQEQPDIRLLTEYLSEYKQNIYHSLAPVFSMLLSPSSQSPAVYFGTEALSFLLFLISHFLCTAFSTFSPFSPLSTCINKHRKLMTESIIRL